MTKKIFSIRHKINGAKIFSGRFKTIAECVETAIEQNIALSYADLSYTNLSGANLDGAILDQANLSHSYCENVNLSEASLRATSFSNAVLKNACLCESDLSYAEFIKSDVRELDITGSELSHTRFADYSALEINFSDTHTLHQCIYQDNKNKECIFSEAPMILKAFSQRIVVFEHLIDINGRLVDPRSLSNHCISTDLKHLKSLSFRLQNYLRKPG